MEISFCTAPGNFRRDIGYGNAGYNIINSLKALGHEVPYDSKTSPIQINFSQPEWYHLRQSQYSIGYTPWESSKLPPSWPDILNSCDEVWTTSEKCQEWFLNNGVRGPVRVYKHGIEDLWKVPRLRNPQNKIRFLHIGEPAQRKGGQLALTAFRAAFGNRDDVHLTIKAFAESTIRHKDNQGNILGPISELNNVTLRTEVMTQDQLLSLILTHDALIYPSYGEGFGLIPLQALATGMPSVVTQWWCPYDKFICQLDYTVGDSPWQHQLHGQVAFPDYDNLVDWYRELHENFHKYAKPTFNKSYVLHRQFDWLTLTKEAFSHLETLPKSDSKNFETLGLRT